MKRYPSLCAGLVATSLCVFLYTPVYTQTSSTEPEPHILENWAENLAQEDGSIDPEDFFTALQKPFNLNKASELQLAETHLLSDIQISNFLLYRKAAGKLISLYELQAIPGFDSLTIQRILPYIVVESTLDDFQGNLADILRQSTRTVQGRWTRFVETQQGYLQTTSGTKYLGDPNQYVLRLRIVYPQRLSIGLVTEKDRGEPLFKDTWKQGLDFTSAHFLWERPTRGIRTLVVGDYQLSFGQGLIAYSGYGFGKSALATSIKRGITPLRAASSTSESGFKRGFGCTLDLLPGLTWTGFVSMRKQDAGSFVYDTIGSRIAVTGLAESGLHRTESERASRDALTRQSAGMSVQYEHALMRLGMQVLSEHLSLPIFPTPRLYNRYYFRGSTLFNTSIDYAFRIRNLQGFGETARSSNGAIASINGLLLSLSRQVDLAMLLRILPPHYQALDAAPFAEGSGGRNERGWYTGLEIRPATGWVIQGFVDTWKNPWLRYTADGPSTGTEYRLQVTYEKRRVFTIYGAFRFKTQEQNTSSATTPFNILAPERLQTFRLHFSRQFKSKLEWRARADIGQYIAPNGARQSGWVLLQDLLYRPIQFPLTCTARISMFNTDSYAIRFYEYENDLLNTFSIAPYYNQGIRAYLNLRFRVRKNITFEARLAQTRWKHPAIIGSGLEAFPGNVKTQVSSQVKVVF